MNKRNSRNVDFISSCAKKFPERAAVIACDKKVSFAKFEILVNRKANFLRENFGRREIAPLLVGHGLEFVVTVYALWKINVIPAPVNVMFSSARLKETLEVAGARKAIASKRFAEKIDFVKVVPIEKNSEVKNFATGIPYDENETALVLFTSGSTGKPKAVSVTFGNLFANAKNVAEYFGASENDAWLASLPFYHIGGFATITRALFRCAPLIIPCSLAFDEQTRAIKRHKPAFFSTVQTTLRRMLESDLEPYPQLKAVFAGGGPVNAATMRAAIERGFPVYKVYGSTETTSMVTILSPAEFEKKPEAAGKPFRGISLDLSDEGEIIVGGKQIARGYFNNAEETKKRFRDGKFHTGDIGETDNDGFLFVTGRKEDFIITGGENVNLQKVKKALLSLEEIADAETFAMPDAEWGEKLCAAIVPKKETTREYVKSSLSQKLAKYEIPKEFIFVKEIPRNDLGKADTKTLRQLFERAGANGNQI